jgi:PAS domain S-box-containing protein
MTSLPDDSTLNTPDDHADDWIAQDQARALAATVLRLRAELDQARADHARAMAESEGRYWALAESLQDILIVLDGSGAPTSVAGDTMGTLGYTHDELRALGTSLWEHLAHPQDLAPTQECLQRARRDETAQRLLMRARDRADEIRWLEVSISPIDGVEGSTGLQVMARDVSDRVQNERLFASLNAAAEVVQRAAATPDSVLNSVVSQLDSLGFTASIALLEEDGEDLRFVRITGPDKAIGAAERLTGIPTSEVCVPVDSVSAFRRAVRAREVVHLTVEEAFLAEVLPEPVKGLARAVARLLAPLKAVVAPLVADDHVLGLLGVAGESLPGNSIPAVALFASQTSIALRNAQLMERIRESEQRYRGIFEAATDALLVVDQGGEILEANPAACDLLGYPRDALVGMSAETLLAEDVRARYDSFLQDTMRSEQVRIEAQLVCQDGKTVPVEAHGAVLTRHDTSRLLLVLHDMSEQVKAQQALVRSEKLDVLGRMAAGIAHDFNNILVSIRGYADIALMDLSSHAEMVRSDIEHILTGAGDAAEAIRRLQSLYRQADDTSDFGLLHLDSLVTEALALTQPQWKDQPQARGVTIDVVRDLLPTAPVVGNASELRRVLANLIVNAIDAMPDGGRLTLATGEDEGWCCVRVSDTGSGIAPEQAEHIFEPFFTTKGGKGSGLGLTVSQNIVERHGGTIAVSGGAGRGATFTVRLPATVERAPTGEPPQDRVAVPIGRSLRVLVVDDEASVRLLLSRLLMRDGHIVREASGGREALNLLRTYPFDLLITDLGMPEVSGHLVAQCARDTQPSVPIILSTGWGETISPDQLRTLGATALLAKPFTYDDLLHAMQTAMAE